MPSHAESVQALLFDLGKVCLQFDHERMVRQLAGVVQASPPDVRTFLIESDLFAGVERGDVSEPALWQRVRETFESAATDEELADAAGDIFSKMPGMGALLSQLGEAGLPRVLVSNTNPFHIRWIRRQFSVLSHFDSLVLSYEVNASKPEPRFYEAAADRAGCPASSCVFVDDLPANVEGARRAGMDGVLFLSVEQLAAELRSRGVLPET